MQEILDGGKIENGQRNDCCIEVEKSEASKCKGMNFQNENGISGQGNDCCIRLK